MDKGTSDFTVIFSTCPAGHQTITEINQAAEGDERKKNGLFQSNAVGCAGLFLKNCAPPHVGAGAKSGPFEKNGILEIAAFEFHAPANLAVVNGHRAFGANFDIVGYERIATDKTATRVDTNALMRDAFRGDAGVDVNASGT
jgi:hypothetical protein